MVFATLRFVHPIGYSKMDFGNCAKMPVHRPPTFADFSSVLNFLKKSLQSQPLTLEAGNWGFGSSAYFFRNLKV